MPLLDISHSYSCFSSSVLAFRSESSVDNKLVVRYGKRLELSSKDCWGGFRITRKMVKTCKFGRPEVRMNELVINAVGVLDMTGVACQSELVNGYQSALRMETDSGSLRSADPDPQSSYEDSEEVDDREKMRRMRISKANKGNMPWNKGRRHTPETIQRIKERTRLAMKDPKVKMKLVSLGHAQTEETRTKIGVGVRLGWERRREKLLLQETCLFEWQNLIAMASRKGLLGEEELQWDSHKILSKKYEIEWVESVEQRRINRRPKGNKRAPKSAEQKRRISKSIAAKWADPEYRTRVCSGLAKFYGTPEGVERKPRRKPSIDDGQARIKSPKKKDQTDVIPKRETKSQVQKIVRKRNKSPSYKDPLASSKLEMLKSIKAQRAAVTDERSEAIYRARMLIAEAEKATKSLEIAAQKSPLAYSSLVESRKLIAEALMVIESIENEDTKAPQNDNLLESDESNNQEPRFDEMIEADASSPPAMKNGKVNGFHSITSTGDPMTDEFGFNNFMLADLVNGLSSWANGATQSEEENLQKSANGFRYLETDGTLKINHFHRDVPAPDRNANGDSRNTIDHSMNGLRALSENIETLKQEIKLVKKWVRGRLVEVAEETWVS